VKFVCEKCNTKYSIADDKVRRKVLKIRCKNCSHIIVVREPGGPGAPGQDRPGRSLEQAFDGAFGRRPSRGKRPSASIDPLPSLHGGPRAEPALVDEYEPEPTRLSQAPDFADLESDGQPSDDDWYLAVDGNQYGPMAFSELCSRIKRGETGDEAYVWRESFNDWLDLHDVAELQPYIPRHPPPPPRGKSGLYQVPVVSPPRSSPNLPLSPMVPQAPFAPQVPEIRGGRSTRPEVPAVVMSAPPSAIPAPQAVPGVVPAPPSQPATFPEIPQVTPAAVAPAGVAPMGVAPIAPPAQAPMVEPDFEPLPAPELAPVVGAPSTGSRTPTWMIIAGIGGGLAALCGVFLVAYSLFVDRPQQDPVAVARNDPHSIQPQPAVPSTAPDAGAESAEIDFPPMQVERSKTRSRSVRSRTTARAPAARAKGPSRTAEQERLMKLYGKSGPSGATPPSVRKRARRSGFVRQVRPSELLRLQRKNKTSLKTCYERALKRDESLSELKAEVTVTIGDSGIVKRVRVKAGNNPSLTTCVTRSIKRWVFPAVGEQTLGFPIIFRGN
jgi:predicted Zn finger-like uncharacterized protein